MLGSVKTLTPLAMMGNGMMHNGMGWMMVLLCVLIAVLLIVLLILLIIYVIKKIRR